MRLGDITRLIPAFSYLRLAAFIGIIAALFWVWRVNDLRASHLETIDQVVTELKEAGLGGANRGNVAAVTKTLVEQRNTARSERDTARVLVETQSNAILALEKETQEYLQNAREQRKMVEEATRQRDIWIARARNASTRTERLSAEEEIRQCEQVLDSLYSQGF